MNLHHCERLKSRVLENERIKTAGIRISLLQNVVCIMHGKQMENTKWRITMRVHPKVYGLAAWSENCH
jgi:hypothetical protein